VRSVRVPPAGTLPADKLADGTVKLADGTTRTAPLVSAADAFTAMRRVDATTCGGCEHLTVTKATLGTTTVRTNQGRATVPAWLFTVAEFDAPIAQVALAPTALTGLPTPSPAAVKADGPVRRALGVGLDRGDPTTLVVRLKLTGCDTDARGRVFQSIDTIVSAERPSPAAARRAGGPSPRTYPSSSARRSATGWCSTRTPVRRCRWASSGNRRGLTVR
jgi:hypothetical protein